MRQCVDGLQVIIVIDGPVQPIVIRYPSRPSQIHDAASRFPDVGHVRRHPVTLASLCMQVFRPRRYKALQQSLADRPMSPDMMEYAVSGRYLYKGRDIESNAKKALKGIISHLDELKDANADDLLVINGTAQGELALTLALLHPDVPVTVVTYNEDSHALIETCAIDFTPNITVITNNNDYEKHPDSYVRLYSDGNAVAYARRRPA